MCFGVFRDHHGVRTLTFITNSGTCSKLHTDDNLDCIPDRYLDPNLGLAVDSVKDSYLDYNLEYIIDCVVDSYLDWM